MALRDLTDLNAVLQAIDEYDDLGQKSFLTRYGFGPSRSYQLMHQGRTYDLKAILAAAHGYQFPDQGPLVADSNFTSGLHTTVPKAQELGFEVVGGVQIPARSKFSWIFQANPAYYDIGTATRTLNEMNWGVKQSKNQISVGDHVYIWQSGPGGGVIADGHILTSPQMEPSQEGPEFIRDESKFSGEALRVRLSIERVLDEPLPRGALLEHPILKNLPILKFANATNFNINSAEDEALEELIQGSKKVLLEERVEEWLSETGYPNDRDKDRDHQARRKQLASGLSKACLEAVVGDPDQFEILNFAQFAHKVYGDPGNQSTINRFLKDGGSGEKIRLAKTIEHLLYGSGDDVQRLNDVLNDRAWKVPGFSEVLATKALSIVYPERWIPMFRMDGEMGKLRVAESPELELGPPLNFNEKSYGEQICWTNDRLRTRVEPLIPGDPWGQMVFLYWLRERADQDSTQQVVWWVNQGSHYREERDGGYLWAPLADRNGRPMRHWQSLRQANPGELVLNYANGRIRGVGTVEEPAIEEARPEELADAWERNGLMVKVRYSELSESISLDDIPVDWRLNQGPPFDRKGAVQQKGYFFELKSTFVEQLAARFPQLGLGEPREPTLRGESYIEPPFADITAAIRSAGMSITDELLRRYHVGLKTRGFVILSGVSGTGKTWLSRLYAEAVGAIALVVPVAPNWTTNEDLLGFQSPLTGSFQATEFTRFLKRAAEEWHASRDESRDAQPFHLILDEMNLAHVEYYFAKFLSAMEIRATDGIGEIELAAGTEVLIPPNLAFVGTVNVDETTRGFADKVFDRAQLIELEVTREAMEAHMKAAPFADDLLAIWDCLREVAPFAFRVADEIAAYVDEAQNLEVGWEAALDEQVLQKVLPKVKGADTRIEPALNSLLAISGDRFPLTSRKAEAMRNGFVQHGFTSYF
ncbi:MAG TPA: EVE domain-containing protein [Solirubrobacterales bacterium]